jgi:hypothetical protein
MSAPGPVNEKHGGEVPGSTVGLVTEEFPALGSMMGERSENDHSKPLTEPAPANAADRAPAPNSPRPSQADPGEPRPSGAPARETDRP